MARRQLSLQLIRVRSDGLCRVRLRHSRRRAILRVQYQLYLGGPGAHDVALEIGGDAENHVGPALEHPLVADIVRWRRADDHEAPRRLHLERRRVAEQEKLNDRHEHELRYHEAVAEDLQKLLAEEIAKCLHLYSIRGLKLRIAAARRSIAMIDSISVSRHRIVRPTPFSMIPRAITMN